MSPIESKINVLIQEQFPILEKNTILLVRQDGIPLFWKNLKEQEMVMASLVGGLWQAAMSIQNKIAPDQKKGFRLSFDQGSTGIMVYPLSLDDRQYYLSIGFRNEKILGKLKWVIQKFLSELAVLMTNYHQKPQEKVKAGYLFSEITDAEIDRLFAFGSK